MQRLSIVRGIRVVDRFAMQRTDRGAISDYPTGVSGTMLKSERAHAKLDMKSSIGVAAIVRILTVPREDSSAEMRAMVWLSGASTMFTKS